MAVNPTITITRVAVRKIARMREAYVREMDCQVVHDSYHKRGFTDSYTLSVDGRVVGYASIAGSASKRDVIKEFFLTPEWRGRALEFLNRVIMTTGPSTIEAQTNDQLLAVLLWDIAADVSSDSILFADAMTTALTVPGATLRRLRRAERPKVFAHSVEPVGDWAIEHEGRVVATGGLMFHYNRPYGDIYMEVAETHRRHGFGSYLVQELKRVAREGGHTPAARCNSDNVPSRRTLERAGMFPCGRILRGRIPVRM
jgi:GNAT superfamily N-acetyltransferase